MVASNLWYLLAYRRITLISASIMFLCVSISVSRIRTTVVALGTHLLRYDFILTTYICSDPISK